MKAKKIIGATLVVLFSLFVIAGFSQKSSAQTNSNNSTSSQGITEYMGQNGMMYGGMMSGPMMNGRMMYGRMGRYMMGSYNATHKLMNRLEFDLSAAKAQASSSAIKSSLSDAEAAIAQLRRECSQTWRMMGYMPMNANHCYWNQPQQKQN